MPSHDHLVAGAQALARGDWDGARASFEAAGRAGETPESLDGLGRARWWSHDVRGAIEARTSAYAAFKRAGRADEAAAVAVWLARELRALLRNTAAAAGWLARAETLAREAPGTSLPGWVALARAESTADVVAAIAGCAAAVRVARECGDADLEIVCLARLGLYEVAHGDVDAGIAHLDEAMAAASAGEADDLQSAGEAYCALMEAAELLGDSERFAQWTAAIAALRGSHGFGPLDVLGSSGAHGNLSSFCGACCGGMYLVTGRLDEAEDELRSAIADLEASGMESRCVHPVTQLAELRVVQGRLEEARSLLEPYEDLPESVRPLAVLDLALGTPEAATARLLSRLDELRELTVAALPLWTVLVDAQIAGGDVDGAAGAAAHVERIAALTGSRRHEGEALFAGGKVAAAASAGEAPDILRAAARTLSEAGMALPACRARLALARSLVETDLPVAISEARAALAAFDRLGAVSDADDASAFLRGLGVRGRTGPKHLDLLSKREVEVLRLVSQGLSNAEIAQRLFISTKTAGHHVSNILAKLGLRSRTEAAAYAALNLGREPVPK